MLSESPLKFKDIVTCVHPRNTGELYSLAELLIEKGIRYWRLFRIFPNGRAKGKAHYPVMRSPGIFVRLWGRFVG